MTLSTNNCSKRREKKAPPRFQHFPAERAKKLKKDWVEKKKIKSIWRRQKQKLGQLAVQAEGTQHEESTTSIPDREPEETELSGEESDQVDMDQPVSAATKTPHVQPRLSAPKMQTRPTLSLPQIDKLHQVPETSSATHRGRSRLFLRGQAGRKGGGSLRGKGKQPHMRVEIGKLLEKIKQSHPRG